MLEFKGLSNKGFIKQTFWSANMQFLQGSLTVIRFRTRDSTLFLLHTTVTLHNLAFMPVFFQLVIRYLLDYVIWCDFRLIVQLYYHIINYEKPFPNTVCINIVASPYMYSSNPPSKILLWNLWSFQKVKRNKNISTL